MKKKKVKIFKISNSHLLSVFSFIVAVVLLVVDEGLLA
jgi:hypothetical protein